MARRKRIKVLLVSIAKGLDVLQPIVSSVVKTYENISLDLFSESNRNTVFNNRREQNFMGILSSYDLILVDFTNISPSLYFDIGIARAIGKPIIFLADESYLDEFPDFLRQSYLVTFQDRNDLKEKLKFFFVEYIENPKRFTPRSITSSDSSNSVVVDLDKLDLRNFENLCFELLSRLGYNQLEWRMKDDLVDAVTTLKKQDPDGFEYDEFWLISFKDNFAKKDLFEMAVHDPEYLSERIYRSLAESDMLSSVKQRYQRNDVPITLLFIIKGNENVSRKLLREISYQDSHYYGRRSVPLTVRIRWWDERIITSLVQNNQALARKYFSTDAISRSGVRLSYEELYKQYAEINEELQTTNQLLISERSKVQLLERDAAWKLLSFTAAHRLGNPMDAIDSELSNLKSALKLNRTDMFEEIIKSMEIPIERAKSIVSEFRNLSVAHEIVPEVIKSEKLHELLRYSAKQAVDKDIDVEFDLENVPEISIDVTKLSDCFGEIVSNALHFLNGDKKQIQIKLKMATQKELPDKIDRTKKYIKITFADNGCGIPFDKKTIIFRPFERSYIHGTGLGLAFCENIIEEHGGKIRENGKVNEGANFEIFLPIIT